MTIEERIENAEQTVNAQRKKLTELVTQYGAAVKNDNPHTLVEVKDLFLGFLFYTRRVEVGLLRLWREVETHRKTIERSEYLSAKKDKEPGKTDQVCKYTAEIASVKEAMMEHITEMIYREMKAINASADDYLNQIIQRLSLLKKEEFNSRNITT